jgi:hypothetical protein
MELENAVEPVLAIVTAALSIIDPTKGAITGFALWAWQKNSIEDWLNKYEQKVKRIDRDKLDRKALKSDEFKALVLQTVSVASQTASDLKREALANALLNSVLPPTSKFTGKQALLRVLSGMSDEEIFGLTALYHGERNGRYYSEKNKEHEITLKQLAEEIGWSEEEVEVTFDGLTQLGLARTWDIEGRWWKITALGNKLIEWCAPVEQMDILEDS